MSGNPRAIEPRDEQQARLIERLQAARGEPVDFEELRAIGIEHPAVLSYELEVAGLPIVQARDATRRTLALDQPLEAAPDEPHRVTEQITALGASHTGHAGEEISLHAAPPRGQVAAAVAADIIGWLLALLALLGRLGRLAVALASHARAVELRGSSRRPRRLTVRLRGTRPGFAAGAHQLMQRLDRRMRAIASARSARAALLSGVLAFSTAATVALALAVIDLAGTPPVSHRADSNGARAPQRQSSGGAGGEPAGAPAPRHNPAAAPQASGGTQAPAAPVRVSPAAAASLEAEGHQLLLAANYAAAVERLLGAIRASGQSPARCAEPTTESCLTFAYALYDLGRALRLKGDSSAAIPVLSRRLQIDNQRAVVQHELALARGSGT
jgi:tetratricopeptide (TPR) repeat protein